MHQDIVTRQAHTEDSGYSRTVTEIPVVAAPTAHPVNFPVRNHPPPWMRMAHRAVHIGSVLLVLALFLFIAVVAEHFENMQAPETNTPKHVNGSR